MAAEITGVTQTVEVQGGAKVVKIKEYQVLSEPSGTYFQFRRPLSTSAADVKSVAAQLSDRIEKVLASPLVTDVDYFQDTSQGGRLQDRMRTYYRSADGTVEGDVESDLAHFGPTYTIAQIRAEIADAEPFIGA